MEKSHRRKSTRRGRSRASLPVAVALILCMSVTQVAAGTFSSGDASDVVSENTSVNIENMESADAPAGSGAVDTDGSANTGDSANTDENGDTSANNDVPAGETPSTASDDDEKAETAATSGSAGNSEDNFSTTPPPEYSRKSFLGKE